MKRVSIFSILACCMGTGAIASTTFYYDTTGNCPGWFINPDAQYCSESVTRVTLPATADNKFFGGYFLGDGTRAIDGDGNILIQPSAVTNLSPSERTANKFVAGDNEILIAESTSMASGWFTCTAVNIHTCRSGQSLYMNWHPGTCWTSSSWPIGDNGTGYDFVFNSWYIENADTKYIKASSRPLTYPEQGNIYYFTGDSYLETSCSEKALDITDQSFNLNGNQTLPFSEFYIKPFACKLPGVNTATHPYVWSNTRSITNGSIVLDNTVAGSCTYTVSCNAGYACTPSDGKTCEYSCTGTECRDEYSSVYLPFLNQDNLCVEISYNPPEPDTGETED